MKSMLNDERAGTDSDSSLDRWIRLASAVANSPGQCSKAVDGRSRPSGKVREG